MKISYIDHPLVHIKTNLKSELEVEFEASNSQELDLVLIVNNYDPDKIFLHPNLILRLKETINRYSPNKDCTQALIKEVVITDDEVKLYLSYFNNSKSWISHLWINGLELKKFDETSWIIKESSDPLTLRCSVIN